MRRVTVVLSSLAIGSAALGVACDASTPEAWEALDAKAQPACLADIAKQHGGSSATAGALAGRVPGIGGPSGDAYYGILFTWDEGGDAETWLCLYDKLGASAVARQIQPAR